MQKGNEINKLESTSFSNKQCKLKSRSGMTPAMDNEKTGR